MIKVFVQPKCIIQTCFISSSSYPVKDGQGIVQKFYGFRIIQVHNFLILLNIPCSVLTAMYCI